MQLTQLVAGRFGGEQLRQAEQGPAGWKVRFLGKRKTPLPTTLNPVDGANNNDTASNLSSASTPYIPYPIAEFKMLRNSYGAEDGQAAGAVINIVTRSGSNDWHGSALYSGRNTVLNARTYFAAQRTAIANAAGQTLPFDGKDKVNRNDWGYSLGGPIIKNKLSSSGARNGTTKFAAIRELVAFRLRPKRRVIFRRA